MRKRISDFRNAGNDYLFPAKRKEITVPALETSSEVTNEKTNRYNKAGTVLPKISTED
jgi:hypothetical protein